MSSNVSRRGSKGGAGKTQQPPKARVSGDDHSEGGEEEEEEEEEEERRDAEDDHGDNHAEEQADVQEEKAGRPPPARAKQAPPSRRRFRVQTTEMDPAAYVSIIDQLKKVYMEKVKPLEEQFRFDKFGFTPYTAAELEAKAQVLLVGPYSTGKTTMVQYLLGQAFPGMHTGPEPTTDRFIAVVHGNEEKIIQGNSVTVVPELPYGGTQQFGSTFLEKFQASVSRSKTLQHMTMIDTPGVLAGKKHKAFRQYDFKGVVRWFAERSDLILLLFDAHKLDISDEFEEVIQELKEFDAKVRLVLNKADHLERDKLTRVYGALLWSMGKVLRSPEVARLYVGSFWDEPRKYEDPLFTQDEATLLDELSNLPRMSPIRKINDLVRRVRVLKVYMCLMATLRSKMPWIPYLRPAKREFLIAALPLVMDEVRDKYDLSPGDIPPIETLRARLALFPDFCSFPRLRPSVLRQLDEVKDKDIPMLMKRLDGIADALEATRQASFRAPRAASTKTLEATKGKAGQGRGWVSVVMLGLFMSLVVVIIAALGALFAHEQGWVRLDEVLVQGREVMGW